MKTKILNLLLILTSLLGYLEWGGGNHIFLFKAESEIILKLFTSPSEVFHPFIILPLAGQILLLVTLFQKAPAKTLTYISIIGLGLLLGFMFIIGLMSLNTKVLFSTIPFLTVSIWAVLHNRKSHKV